MTRMLQNRRELLKSAAAISAAASFGTIGTTPAGAAEGGRKDALAGIDQAFRQATDAKEVPGVVAVAATGDGVLYEGAFGKRDLAKGTDMTLEFGVLDRVDDQGAHRDRCHAARGTGQTQTGRADRQAPS